MYFHEKICLFSAALQAVSAQATTACNNSPELCSQQYSDITYLGSHNAPFLRDSSTGFSTSGNQFYNSTVQLSAGVRLLSAQVQNPTDSTALHVCHSSCELLDAGTLSSWLSEIKTWMDSNPNDVVTILLVNGAGATASALAESYTSSGLSDLAYTPTSLTATSTWPTLAELISSGSRAMNFVATLDDNAAAPYLMNEFNYMFENDFDNSSPTDFSCEPNRPASLAGTAGSTAISSGYMSLMNHFLYENQAFGIQSPNESYVETTNAPSGGIGNLGTAAATCQSAYGRAPTFVLVDFFNVGPAIEVVDSLNGITPTGRIAVSAEVPSATSDAAPMVSKTLFTWVGLAICFLL